MKQGLVLFDIDGTLLLTGGAGLRAMVRAAGELFGSGFVWDGVNPAGGLDPLLFEEAARHSGIPVGPEDHASFRSLYVRYLEDELSRTAENIRRMPGVRETLDALRRRSDIVLGLLTGNYEPAARLKLRATGIPLSWFRVSAFGDEGDSRQALVRLAIQRFEELVGEAPHPERVVVVGDTPRDVEAARANGCRCFALATGRFSVRDLSESGAHEAVEDLEDPAPLFRFLGIGKGEPEDRGEG